MDPYPLLIEFVPGTSVSREPASVSALPILQNGPPGTFVRFADGSRVSLPTDQIVHAEDSDGGARVAFGAMSYGGIEGAHLVFYRERDLVPSELLSPERGMKMTLSPTMVARVLVDGIPRWPIRPS